MTELERVARAALAEGGTVLRATWRERKTVEYKSAIDLVTATDREVESLIVGRLRHAFPSHRIVAEEASAGGVIERPAATEDVWYVDPLDGTTNFAHAYPHFAISLAFAHGGETRFAIVYDPLRDETFSAEHRRGARLNGTADHGIANDGSRRRAARDRLSLRSARAPRVLPRLSRAIRTTRQGVRRNGSAALDLCYVACGRSTASASGSSSRGTPPPAPRRTRGGRARQRFPRRTVRSFGKQTLASNGRLHAAMATMLAARSNAPPHPVAQAR